MRTLSVYVWLGACLSMSTFVHQCVRVCVCVCVCAQTLLKDVEDRLSQSASEVEMLRASRAALERRYQGCKTKAEAEQLQKELETQAAAAAEKHNDYASLCNRTEVRPHTHTPPLDLELQPHSYPSVCYMATHTHTHDTDPCKPANMQNSAVTSVKLL